MGSVQVCFSQQLGPSLGHRTLKVNGTEFRRQKSRVWWDGQAGTGSGDHSQVVGLRRTGRAAGRVGHPRGGRGRRTAAGKMSLKGLLGVQAELERLRKEGSRGRLRSAGRWREGTWRSRRRSWCPAHIPVPWAWTADQQPWARSEEALPFGLRLPTFKDRKI